MRKIGVEKIKEAVAELCIKANIELPPDILELLKSAYTKETKTRAKKLLKAIIDNAAVAKTQALAICQDTGLPVVFVEIGQDVCVVDGSLDAGITQGVVSGYKKAYLRSSVISDPIRRGKPGFGLPVIHYRIVPGKKLKLTVLPKGFGCENKSQVRMFRPTARIDEIKKFIIDAVKSAGPDACPPFVVGVGIGGTQDYACLLAKKALLRKLPACPAGRQTPCLSGRQANSLPVRQAGKLRTLEHKLLRQINKLNIGPMGLGGRTTALAVNIETYPTHIAGLPVAVNISCHALRSATKQL